VDYRVFCAAAEPGVFGLVSTVSNHVLSSFVLWVGKCGREPILRTSREGARVLWVIFFMSPGQ